MTHPLVLSYHKASALVDGYLVAHRRFLDWAPDRRASSALEAPMTPGT
jgi:hypothetical protein